MKTTLLGAFSILTLSAAMADGVEYTPNVVLSSARISACRTLLHVRGIATRSRRMSQESTNNLAFPSSWTATGSPVSTEGLGSSANTARLPSNTNASLAQTLKVTGSDFTADRVLQILGNKEAPAFRLILEAVRQPAIELRSAVNGELQVKEGAIWKPLYQTNDGMPFKLPVNQPLRLRFIGCGFGTAGAGDDLAWTDPGTSPLAHAALDLTARGTPGWPPLSPRCLVGKFVVINNGRPTNQSRPTGAAGVLATWDGVTVANNGGAYLAIADPNNAAEEDGRNPVAAQNDFIAGWTQVS